MSNAADLMDKLIRDGVVLAAGDGHYQLHDHHHQHDHAAAAFEPLPTTDRFPLITPHSGGADDDAGFFTDIVVAKSTAMAVLFVAALCAGLVPFKLAQWLRWQQGSTEQGRTGLIVSLLLAFGGGVLLCTTFLHLLPEVKENVERLQASGALPHVGFQLAEFLMCVGFFTMYFIEQLVHAYMHSRDAQAQRRSKQTAESAFRRGVSVRESGSAAAAAANGAASATSAVARRKKLLNDQRNGSISVAELIENDANENHHRGSVEDGLDGRYLATVESVQPQVANNNGGHMNGSNGTGHSKQNDEHSHHQQHAKHGHGHSHLHLPVASGGNRSNDSGDDDAVASSLRGLLIVLALSVHELFEGLAVGLESSASNVWYLFGAVAAHKLVLAFCVGVELIVARTHKWLAFAYVLTFSVVSPLGIGIGILVSQFGQQQQADGSVGDGGAVVAVLLQGLASGTLLYVVFFEILQKDKAGLVQLVAVLCGFFIMFGLQFISEYAG